MQPFLHCSIKKQTTTTLPFLSMMKSKNIFVIINVHVIITKKTFLFQNYTMCKHIACNSLQPRKGFIIISEIFVYCDSDTSIIQKHYFSIFNKTFSLTEGENKFILTTNYFDGLLYNPRDLFSMIFEPDPNTFWTFIPSKDNELRIIISTNKIVSLALLARAYIPRKNETEINSYPIPLSQSRIHFVQITTI